MESLGKVDLFVCSCYCHELLYQISHLEASEMGGRPTPEMPRDAKVSENDDKAESDISSLANDRTAQTISAISDNQRKIQSLGKTLSDKKPVSQVGRSFIVSC